MKVPDIIKEAARKLRKNQTESEVLLWNEIRYDKLGVRFLRQKPLYLFTDDNGLDRFIIPDFYCDENKIVLEIDGSVHELCEVLLLDIEKEKLLSNLGIKVIRLKNHDIKSNIKLVIQNIKEKL